MPIMKIDYKRKRRIWGKTKPRMPKPGRKDADSFALRLISEADSRYAVVKEMKRRLERLIDDAGLTSIQQEWLAARAVFLVARCESQEVASMEGKKIDEGGYVQTVNALSGLLNKIGLDKKTKQLLTTLEEYAAEKDSKPNKKRKKKHKHLS